VCRNAARMSAGANSFSPLRRMCQTRPSVGGAGPQRQRRRGYRAKRSCWRRCGNAWQPCVRHLPRLRQWCLQLPDLRPKAKEALLWRPLHRSRQRCNPGSGPHHRPCRGALESALLTPTPGGSTSSLPWPKACKGLGAAVAARHQKAMAAWRKLVWPRPLSQARTSSPALMRCENAWPRERPTSVLGLAQSGRRSRHPCRRRRRRLRRRPRPCPRA